MKMIAVRKQCFEREFKLRLTFGLFEGTTLSLGFEVMTIIRLFVFLTSRDFDDVLVGSRAHVFVLLDLLLLESLGGGTEVATVALGKLLLDFVPEGVLGVVLTGSRVDETLFLFETFFG